MPGPKNAINLANGVRMYRWTDPATGEDTDVLSVTSIRKLCGESFILTQWKVSNVVNVAMGQRKNEALGPRGGKPKGYVPDGSFPGEFAKRLLDSGGDAAGLNKVRSWLQQMADSPRDVAAARGTVVHEAIENRVSSDRINEQYVEWAFQRAKTTAKPDAADVKFIHECMRQFEDLQAHTPYVVVAREPQIWNLTAGYAGSLDCILWFLPEGTSLDAVSAYQQLADDGKLTIAVIRSVGGRLSVGDYKTSPEVYTDHVTQVHAYIGGEFVGSDGVIDKRLTDILHGVSHGTLLHIRPNRWNIDTFEFREDIMYAFLGSVAFARFLARNPTPNKLFIESSEGSYDGNANVVGEPRDESDGETE